jgi:hypothetical protein
MYHIIHKYHNPVTARVFGQSVYDTSRLRYHRRELRERPIYKGYEAYDMYDS